MTTAYLALLVAGLAGAVVALLREADRRRPTKPLASTTAEAGREPVVEPVRKAA